MYSIVDLRSEFMRIDSSSRVIPIVEDNLLSFLCSKGKAYDLIVNNSVNMLRKTSAIESLLDPYSLYHKESGKRLEGLVSLYDAVVFSPSKSRFSLISDIYELGEIFSESAFNLVEPNFGLISEDIKFSGSIGGVRKFMDLSKKLMGGESENLKYLRFFSALEQAYLKFKLNLLSMRPLSSSEDVIYSLPDRGKEIIEHYLVYRNVITSNGFIDYMNHFSAEEEYGLDVLRFFEPILFSLSEIRFAGSKILDLEKIFSIEDKKFGLETLNKYMGSLEKFSFKLNFPESTNSDKPPICEPGEVPLF